MKPEDMIAATILFWVLAILSVSLPPRYGIVAYILLVQFDLTGVAFYADSSFGWENAIKAVVIPTILLLRVRPIDRLPLAFRPARNFWIALVTYAGISILWTPYVLSAVKMMGYFYSYSVMFLVFACAWRRKWFSHASFVLIISLSIAFAIMQTYALGNGYGDPLYDNRFTTFSDAQSFAPFLICSIILLILSFRRSFTTWFAAGVAVIGLLLTGSRSYFLGFAWVCLMLVLALAKRFRHRLSISLILKSVTVTCVVLVLLTVFVARALPQDRLNELLKVADTHDDSIEDVQTFAWRVTIWSKTVQEIANRNLWGVVRGSGTSSAATVAMETGYFRESNVDPNRCIHDEFLRSLYEWGVIGLAALVCFLVALFGLSFRLARLSHSPHAWACLAISVPLVFGLLIENILADGSSPGGIGYCLVFACMVAQLRPAPENVKAFIAPEQPTAGILPSET